MTASQIVTAWVRRQLARVWFLFLVLVTYYMAGWYHMYGLLLLAVTEGMVLAGMGILVWYLAAHLEVSVHLPDGCVRKGQAAVADVTVRNTGIFPVFKVTAILRCSGDVVTETTAADLGGRPGKTAEYRVFYGAVAAGRQCLFHCPLPTAYCGTVTVSLWQLRVVDYMNLFIRNQHFRAGTGQKKRPDSSAMLTILPVWRVADIHGKPPASLPPVPDGPVCWEDEMSAQTGHDPYEIRQLHAFRPGDSLRDIHWKVSARTDELMCKEYDGTEEPLAALLLEMETEEAAVDICRMDIFREIGAALSAGLLQAGIRHIVYWYDSGRQTVAGRQIRQEEDHLLMSAELVRTCPGTRLNEEQTGIIRHLLRGGCRETAVLSLDLSLRLYENGKLLRQFSPEEYPRELAALPDMFV